MLGSLEILWSIFPFSCGSSSIVQSQFGVSVECSGVFPYLDSLDSSKSLSSRVVQRLKHCLLSELIPSTEIEMLEYVKFQGL